MSATAQDASGCFMSHDRLQELLDALRGQGYQVVGPTISQGAIIYDEVHAVNQLPKGWTDHQEPGLYRLERREDEQYFGYVVGPHSWKKYLFPPLTTVAVAERVNSTWQMKSPNEAPPKYAFLGVRACELAAIGVQDRVFINDAYSDPDYKTRREQCFIVAVNCTLAGQNCFCTSMQTGPRCRSGFDIALTEIADGFTVEVGSDSGQQLVSALELPTASDVELDSAEASRCEAELMISKKLDTTNIRETLLNQLNHPHWADVAQRCLSCTNCTMVCPTCFCASVTEVADLQGDHVERQRQWDSCFNLDFSYMNGGNVRNDIRSRYRQWLTHKLASWIDQFGTSGCVGCGRCITWCPVGIDLTEEVAALRKVPS